MRINRSLFLMLVLLPCSLYCQDTVFNKLDRNRHKTGPWKTYYNNGKIRYTGYFEDDKPVGEMRRYYPGGLLQAIMVFERNSNVSYAKLFNENGRILAEGKYDGKMKDSVWNYYSSFDGHLAMRESFNLGKRNGVSLKYYPDGNISEIIEWYNDLQHGKWEQYYENGNIRLRSSFIEGKRDGDFESFYSGGRSSITGEYKDGVMTGIWTYFKENGEKDFSVEYIEGKMVPNQEYENRVEEFSKKAREIAGEFPEPEEIQIP